jgi:hypothetical protein
MAWLQEGVKTIGTAPPLVRATSAVRKHIVVLKTLSPTTLLLPAK